jgi:hypothetical protein
MKSFRLNIYLIQQRVLMKIKVKMKNSMKFITNSNKNILTTKSKIIFINLIGNIKITYRLKNIQ